MKKTGTVGRYAFEGGNLVKIDMLRPEYMNGPMLLLELRKAAQLVAQLTDEKKELKKQLKVEAAEASRLPRVVTYKFSTEDNRLIAEAVVKGNGWEINQDYTTGVNLAVMVAHDDEQDALHSVLNLHSDDFLQWDRL